MPNIPFKLYPKYQKAFRHLPNDGVFFYILCTLRKITLKQCIYEQHLNEHNMQPRLIFTLGFARFVCIASSMQCYVQCCQQRTDTELWWWMGAIYYSQPLQPPPQKCMAPTMQGHPLLPPPAVHTAPTMQGQPLLPPPAVYTSLTMQGQPLLPPPALCTSLITQGETYVFCWGDISCAGRH